MKLVAVDLLARDPFDGMSLRSVAQLLAPSTGCNHGIESREGRVLPRSRAQCALPNRSREMGGR